MSDLAELPVDLAHLNKYTGGDLSLNSEVFRLFSRHCSEMLRLLETLLDAPERKAWRQAAHSLKGAALGIGAFDLAEAASAVEAVDPGSAPARAARLLHSLNERSAVVLAHIETYLID